ncbi:MAG: EamA family transporter [Gammaproteobacteria bacterium]|nr:MAG: EamA family transporter [Gammaproteobacteria bacterium]
MTLAAVAALTLSVLLHVAWNLMARRSEPDARFLWWALLGWLVLVGPWSLVQLALYADWSWRLATLLGITCAAEAMYFLALGNAYRHAPVPLVYPIARSSPVLIALWTVLLFGETLSLGGWTGIVVSVAGVLALAATARASKDESARALPWAFTAALGTSIYSTANKLAVPALPGYGVMLGYVSVTFLAAWLALTWENHQRGRRLIPKLAPHPFKWIVGGLCIGNAYALVIYAMQFIPAAYAVAFTNAGIVLAGVIAMVAFRERERWRTRLAAMLVVCAGLALVAAA